MLSEIQAVIFDMDGVIFDSEQVYFDACLLAAKRNSVNISESFARSFSGRTSLACQLILKDFLQSDEKAEKFWQDWGQARQEILLTKGLGFKEGFLDLFGFIKAKEFKTALVTSANKSDLIDNFSRNDSTLFKLFSPIITIEDVKHPKPHPEPYEKAIHQLGLLPTQCIVIEDSFSGVSAALAAGAQTIMVSTDPLNEAFDGKLLYKANKHEDILKFIQKYKL